MNRMTVGAAGLSFITSWKKCHPAILVFVFLVSLLGTKSEVLNAQQGNPEDPLLNVGIPPFNLTIPIQGGYINMGTGQPTIQIPMASVPQRSGPPVAIKLVASGTDWAVLTNGLNKWEPGGAGFPSPTFNIETNPGVGGGTWGGGDQLGTICRLDGVEEWDTFGGFVYYENGTTHSFPVATTLVNTGSACRVYATDQPTADGLALDGSGYHIYVMDYTTVAQVYAPDGTLVYSCFSGSCLNSIREDSNGNKITWVYHTQPPYDEPMTDMENRTLVTTTVNGSTTTYGVLNSKGGTSSYVITSATINVKTNFHATTTNTPPDYTGTMPVTQSIQLPDNTSYTFKYDCDSTTGPACGSPSGQTAYYGDMISMTLPTTGQIQYKYNNFIDAEGSLIVGGHVYTHVTRGITQMTTPDGTWNFAPLVVSSSLNEQQLTVTRPGAEKEVHMVRVDGGVWPYETDYYDATGNLNTSLTATYDYSNMCSYAMSKEGICTTYSFIYVNNLTKTITLPVPGSGGTVSTTTGYTWDPAHTGNVTLKSDWNFGSSTSGSADRTTSYTYLVSPNLNIIDRRATVTIKNSGGSIVAQTNNCYDGSTTSPCNYSSTPASATGKTQHDDTGYPASYTSRGNLTQVLKLISGTSNYLSTSRTVYDMTGQVVSSVDSNSNTTSFDYTDNLYDDFGDGSNPTTHNVSQATNAYLKKITHPTVNSVTLTETFGYYWGSGKTALSTDPNNQTTYSHFYDPLDRPTSTKLPNSGWTYLVYASSDTQVDSGVGITSTTLSASCTGTSGGCRHDRTLTDNLGRVTSKILVSDPDGQTTVGTTYDSDGRVSTVSNPHRSTSSSTDGTESYNYDGLNRTAQVNHADGNIVDTYYGASVSSNGGLSTQKCSGYGVGYPILSKDEAGRPRQSWTDGFGRLIEIDEPNTSGSLSSGLGTCYGYDLNNNLTAVAQGSLTRSFSYDMLSRFTVATNPESQTTNYYYTTSGGSLCSGVPAEVCRRTDARTITTTYAYDALNRVTSKAYSDSTWPIYYYYDGTSSTNPYGRLTSVYTYNPGTGVWVPEAWFNYDAVGNMTEEIQWVAGVYQYAYYTYNLDGSTATVKYPSGRVVTYATSNAQRPTTATDTTTSTHINYALGPSSCPFGQSNGMNWACYAPPGELDALKNGASLTTNMFYNSRLQPCRTAVNSGSTTVPASCTDTHYGDKFDIQYSFDLSTVNTPCTTSFGVATDNGNVASIKNNVTSMSGRSQQFCYDALNRISSARTTSTYSNGPSYCWGEAYTIDTVANLTSIAQMTPTYNGCVQESGFSTTVNSHNQDALSCYDAAGNKVGASGGSCSPLPTTYHYDAENRICSFGGTSCTTGTFYVYDADGNRMEKSSGTLYWYGTHGEILAETNLGGGNLNEYVFFGGKRIARVNASGSVYYYFADNLGSSRAIVQDGPTPTLCYDADFYPYGGERTPYTNTCSQNYKFTGKERDSESGLDNFGARYDSSQYGRFMSPDPLGGSLSNPQTLNKYSYVHNNPINFTDPTGLFACGADTDRKVCEQVDQSRMRDLQSKDKGVFRSAQALGPLSQKAGDAGDNGVTVRVGDPGKGNDGITTHDVGADPNSPNGLRAVETVTLRAGLSGSALDTAVGHEGSHVADAQDFVSAITSTGGMDQSKNLTSYQTELKAYMVTQSILASGNEKRGYGQCGTGACMFGAGIGPAAVTQTINQLLANPANQYGTAPNYGVTPANPGPVLYPNLTAPR